MMGNDGIGDGMGGSADVVGMMTMFQKKGRGFDALWGRVGPVVGGMARQLLRKRLVRGPGSIDDEAAVDDVCQQVAIKLLELPGKGPKAWYDPAKGGLRRWLFGVARNAVTDYCRLWHGARDGRKVLAESSLTPNALPDDDWSILKLVAAQNDAPDWEVREIVNAAVDALADDDLRAVIRLKMAEDLSERKLAEWLATNVSAVHRRLHEAYDLLRANLKTRGIDAEWLAA